MFRSFMPVLAIVILPLASFAAPDIIDRLSPGQFEALEMLRLATEYKVAEVRQAIGKCRDGKYAEAVPVLTKYANEGDVGATYVLAKLYLDGLGVEKSQGTARSLYQVNADGGHAPSMMILGSMKEADAPAEALQLYKQAARLDDVSAIISLGAIYEQGRLGMRANPKLAFSQYEKAHKTGHPVGDYHMGRCYDAGIGVSPDALKATRYFKTAALAGVTQAQVVMARRYYEGKGLEPDPIAAFGWLTRAAQFGSTEAMILLGQRYEAGDVIAQDLNTAGQLYSAAAKKGDPTGRYHLALMYLNGKGTKPDPVRAYVLLEAAQALPKAKEAFDQLTKQLTPEQLTLAKKKIAEGKGK